MGTAARSAKRGERTTQQRVMRGRRATTTVRQPSRAEGISTKLKALRRKRNG